MINDEQSEFINLKYNEYAFLNAPAGTGKTFSLIQKIKKIQKQNKGKNSLLYISFTNATVIDFKKKIILNDEGSRKSNFIDISTIDMFVRNYLKMSFLDNKTPDDVIRMGVSRLEEINSKFDDFLDEKDLLINSLKHIFIDEIQDVNGDRAELIFNLVKYIVKRNRYLPKNVCGVSIAGDFRQAIYNRRRVKSSKDMINQLDNYIKENQKNYQLNKFNYIQNRRINENAVFMRIIVEYLNSVFNDDRLEDTKEVYFNEIYENILPKGSIEDIKKLMGEGRVVAMLTFTNKNAFLLYIKLLNLKLQNIGINDSSRMIKSDQTTLRLSKNIVDYFDGSMVDWKKKLEKVFSGKDIIEFEKQYFFDRGLSIDYTQISQSSLIKFLFTVFYTNDNILIDNLKVRNLQKGIISTIHSAKGLEYDIVFVDDSDKERMGPLRVNNQRLLYVGITRSKFMTYNFDSENELDEVENGENEDHRFFIDGDRKEKRFRVGMPGDVDESSYFKWINESTREFNKRKEKIKTLKNGANLYIEYDKYDEKYYIYTDEGIRLCYMKKTFMERVEKFFFGQNYNISRTSFRFENIFFIDYFTIVKKDKPIVPGIIVVGFIEIFGNTFEIDNEKNKEEELAILEKSQDKNEKTNCIICNRVTDNRICDRPECIREMNKMN